MRQLQASQGDKRGSLRFQTGIRAQHMCDGREERLHTPKTTFREIHVGNQGRGDENKGIARTCLEGSRKTRHRYLPTDVPLAHVGTWQSVGQGVLTLPVRSQVHLLEVQVCGRLRIQNLCCTTVNKQGVPTFLKLLPIG